MKVKTGLVGLAMLVSTCVPNHYTELYREHYITDNNPLYLEQSVGNTLSTLYNNVDVEVPLCLHGSHTDSMTTIDKVTFPLYLTNHEDYSSFDKNKCLDEPDYIGMVHNHKNSNCDLSNIDLHRFVTDEDSDIEMIVCKSRDKRVDFSFKVWEKTKELKRYYNENVKVFFEE